MSSAHRPSTGDRASFGVALALGAAVSVTTVINAVIRIIQIASNRDVPVTASFADTPATLPIGPGGEPVTVIPQLVTLTVSDVAPATVVSLVLAELVYAAAVLTVVALLSLLSRNIIRGEAFSRRSVTYVNATALAVGVGIIATWMFRTMGANGAAAALAGEYPANTPFALDLPLVFVIASLGAIAVAWQAGYRLQRDTEGLV